MTSSLVIPALAYPFESAVISPHVDAVERAVRGWAARGGLYMQRDPADYERIQVGRLAGLAHPRGSLAGLTLAGKWLMWLFAFDDHFSDESAIGFDPAETITVVTRMLGILDGVPHRRPKGPFEVTLADFMGELAACATPVQRGRFLASVGSYFHAFIWEAANRARSTYPTVETYRHMRYHGGAVPSCLTLIDTVNEFELPADDYYRPETVTLVRLASNLICWSNDIFSYAKEVVRNGIVHSLPTILQHHLDIDIQKAIDRAAQMHDDEVGRYEQLERRMRDMAGPHLRRFLDDINSWIVGNVTWTHTCQRYCSHVALRPVESLLLAGGPGKIGGGLHGTEVAP
jgi:hypothetical protein